jgi:hypothetical protein
MKCRYTTGNYSVVVSASRRGVASLGAYLQDIPDVSLFAVCTESASGDRLWTALWYRKPSRDIHLVDGLRGLAYVLSADIANLRFTVLSQEGRERDLYREYKPTSVDASVNPGLFQDLVDKML